MDGGTVPFVQKGKPRMMIIRGFYHSAGCFLASQPRKSPP